MLYLVLGFLAIQFARGEVSGQQVNQTGAFESLGHSGWGKCLLVLLIVGLAALCAFAAIQAIVGDPIEGDEAKDRVKFAGRSIVYASLTVTAIKVAVDAWSAGSNDTAAKGAGDQTQKQTASTMFDLPAGRFLVVVLGLVLIGIGGYHVWHSVVQAKFMKRLDPPSQGRTAIEAAGRFGYAARSVVFAGTGVFFLVAAVQYDPNRSKGISGTLQTMSQYGWGRALLWFTALGLFVFGVFCLAEARYRRHG